MGDSGSGKRTSLGVGPTTPDADDRATPSSRVRARPSSEPAPRPDDLVAGSAVGEYVVEALIGRGGMGTVYAGRQPIIGKRVAIKVLSSELPDDPSLVRRFIDEARAVNTIAHPNIIDIFSFGELPDGRQYFVMELLEGRTLRDWMETGPIPPAEFVRYVTQICSALEAAHREQIVHRDLKPENIWIATPKHGESHVKVLDFGIAKLMTNQPADSVTQTGVAMGTPYFMSPEQCRGREVDHRTDIYALGVILYELYSGRLPFQGETFLEVLAQHLTAPPPRLSALGVAVPAGVERLILACLEKEPGRRPQTASEVAARFEAAIAAQAPDALDVTGAMTAPVTLAPAPDAPEPTAVGRSASGRWLLAAFAVTLALLAALWFSASEPNTSAPEAAAPTPTEPTAPTERAVVLGDSPGPAVPPSAHSPEEAGAVGAETEAATGAAPTAPTAPTKAASTEAAPTEAEPGASEPPAGKVTGRAAAPEGTRTRVAPSRVEKQGLVTDNPFQ